MGKNKNFKITINPKDALIFIYKFVSDHLYKNEITSFEEYIAYVKRYTEVYIIELLKNTFPQLNKQEMLDYLKAALPSKEINSLRNKLLSFALGNEDLMKLSREHFNKMTDIGLKISQLQIEKQQCELAKKSLEQYERCLTGFLEESQHITTENSLSNFSDFMSCSEKIIKSANEELIHADDLIDEYHISTEDITEKSIKINDNEKYQMPHINQIQLPETIQSAHNNLKQINKMISNFEKNIYFRTNMSSIESINWVKKANAVNIEIANGNEILFQTKNFMEKINQSQLSKSDIHDLRSLRNLLKKSQSKLDALGLFIEDKMFMIKSNLGIK